MSDPLEASVPYRVIYSGRALNRFRALVAQAQPLGLAAELLAAGREMDRRLRTYPQFGDPLQDLTFIKGQLRIAAIPPLVVRYVLDEENRLVIVLSPLSLSKRGR